MTRWLGAPGGERGLGPRALLRDWVAALRSPERCFAERVVPGEQAPALAFAMAVAAVAGVTRLALVPASRPDLGGPPLVDAAATLGVVVVLVAPLVLHLVAAVQTAVLLLVVPEPRRDGVSGTVQVVAYASAPCVAAGVPVPAVVAAVAAWGAVLLVVGIAVRNDLSGPRAAAVAALPAALLFGYAWRGFAAVAATAQAVVAAAG
ncbi:MAG: YIP1 family protein [Halobacteriaceae archaeon]